MQHQTGSPQQFCLRWNNYQSNLTNVFDQLLQSESFVDVTLACDGHSVKAHKMVLSACSPYFQSLFFDNPCQHPIVIMRDIKWPELKAAVEFMYKGEINVSQEQIGPLLKVAESLKIRGLADVNGEQDVIGTTTPTTQAAAGEVTKTPTQQAPETPEWESRPEGGENVPPRTKKRRRSGERSSLSSPAESASIDMPEPAPSVEMSPAPPATPLPPQTPQEPLPLTLPIQHPSHSSDDMEIKPGIAEMIREEERKLLPQNAKLLESSHAWLGAASTSSIADSYQYQLQSMWQKCWNTNQSLVHNLRFRERGPLKSWRPETMAEAIFSVLKEGLSLSQAARKYDIPYPTFVLYANRVHNMLGPSADGGSDLRPKGRGRPQRILLGVWPDEHIRGVIRAVVFRDSHQIKEEPLGYPRIQHPLKALPNVTNFSKFTSKQEKDWDSLMKPQENRAENCWDGVNMQNYPNNNCSSNGQESNVSPGAAATAAAVAAVAQGLRQQMCSMVAAAQHQSSAHDTNPVASLVNSLALAGHCGGVSMASNGAPPISMSHMASMRMASPAGSIQDLRISPAGSGLESPISSPLGLTVSSSMEPSMGMGMGNNMDVSALTIPGMGAYKPPRTFASPRPDTLFHEDIDELVKPMHGSNSNRQKDPITSIKLEPLTECRGE
ncbi:protein bric-a-brac 1-like isoform X2 [Onthophagus taurus]|uniref:protein bric-a-brac 1-like isoform X2 n=1 Tax=Onthophagus taurus TaxID=166361 RepID=UPI0039BDB434